LLRYDKEAVIFKRSAEAAIRPISDANRSENAECVNPEGSRL
jgi:hypothetical protein